jgi:ABC-2 type transport system permease protein
VGELSKIKNIIKKYFLLYLQLLKLSLISQMEYRSNFFIGFIVESGFLFTKIMYLIVVYNINITINGYSPNDMMLYIGTFSIITAFYTGFIMVNFYEIPEHIKNGTLDIFMTKPISLQFMVTLRKADFSMTLPNMIGGVAMVVLAWEKSGIPVNVFSVLGYIGFIVSGIIIAYSVFLFPQLLSFWIVETKAIIQIADRGWDFNTMPMTIYTKWIQRLGMFVFPIFAISNLPSMFLIGKMDFVHALWAVVAPIFFIVLIRLFWNYAIRNYSSASS